MSSASPQPVLSLLNIITRRIILKSWFRSCLCSAKTLWLFPLSLRVKSKSFQWPLKSAGSDSVHSLTLSPSASFSLASKYLGLHAVPETTRACLELRSQILVVFFTRNALPPDIFIANSLTLLTLFGSTVTFSKSSVAIKTQIHPLQTTSDISHYLLSCSIFTYHPLPC